MTVEDADDEHPHSSQLSLDDQLGIPQDATVNVPSSLSIRLVSVSASSSLELTSQSCRRFSTHGGRGWLVGRQAATADFRLSQAGLSRQHAVLYCRTATTKDGNDHDLQLFLKDLGSKHGTTVNRSRVAATVGPLHDGDVVQFGAGPEPVFRVEIQRRQPQVGDPEAPESNPARISADRSLLDDAGHGLEGRARRQAELQAMMASLDQAPVYHQPATAVPSEVDGGAILRPDDGGSKAVNNTDAPPRENPAHTVARQHGLPLLRRLTLPSEVQRGTVTCLAVDAAGSRFVMGCTDTHMRWYDFGGMGQHKLESFRDTIPEDGHLLQSCVFSPTGDRLLVGTSSVQPQVFDRESQEVIKFCRGDMYVTDPTKTVGHTAQVTSVDWHPLERHVVLTGSLDGSARLWNLNGKTQFKMLVCDRVFAVKSAKGHRTAVTCVAFHPGGHEFAVGTVCGSIQIWSRAKATATRPERAVYEAHKNKVAAAIPIHCLTYSSDGALLASRSAEDNAVRVWNPQRLSRSSLPLAVCTDLETSNEHANACFSPDGSLLCAGRSISKGSGNARREIGALHVYQLPDVDEASMSEPTKPLLSLPLDGAPVRVLWHHKLNQIFVACADGQIHVFFDPDRSSKGALLAASRESRPVDALSELLRTKAESAVPTEADILTPLSMPKGELDSERKRKRLERKDPIKSREPERPATGKHKTGAQSGGMLTFQQFVADQRVSQSKAIAGKDPREALLQYTDGKSKSYVASAYEGNVSKLAEKTAEQEEEEAKGKTS